MLKNITFKRILFSSFLIFLFSFSTPAFAFNPVTSLINAWKNFVSNYTIIENYPTTILPVSTPKHSVVTPPAQIIVSSNAISEAALTVALKKLLNNNREIFSQFRGLQGIPGPQGLQGIPGTSNVSPPLLSQGSSPSYISSGYAPIAIIPPNPATNFSGATLLGATNLSSDVLTTRIANIVGLNVSGSSALAGLSVTGDLHVTGDIYQNGSLLVSGSGGSSEWTTTGSNIYYNTGNIGIGTTAPVELLSLGNTGTTKGVLSFAGDTSGKVIIQPASAAGTYTLTLPTNDGDASQVLTTDGSGILSWTTVSGGSGGGDMTLAGVQTITGAKTFNNTKFLLRNVADTFNGSFVNTNTADRIYTLPDAAGTVALTNNKLSVFAATTSAELLSVLSDESGTGNILTTNGSAANLTSFPTFNQDTSGTATKATNLIGGNGTTLLGAVPYQSGNDTTLFVVNTSATKKFLRETGNGTNGAAPAWDTLATTDIPDLSATYAPIGQTMYIGTTAHALNRTTAAEGLAGITSLTPGADFTLSQNSVATLTSIESGALVNTLYLKAGNVGIGTTAPGQKLDVTGNINVSAGSAYMYNGSIIAQASTSLYNYFFGGAGNLTMTGVKNTANGYQALLFNTTGFNNNASGYRALYSNTTGNYNTANGMNALYSNTIGYQNTANGESALYSNTTGNYNTANGVYGLYHNITGNYNTADGIYALFSSTTGDQNTANGTSALYSNTTGYNNTANGMNALYSNTTGYNNTANGMNALYYNTTGNYNTTFGYQAGYNDLVTLETMTNSTFIGTNANSSLDGVTNSMALGNGAQVTKSNQVVIGSGSVTETLLRGNVGIGTTAPGYNLEVNGTVMFRGGIALWAPETDTIIGGGLIFKDAWNYIRQDTSHNLNFDVLNNMSPLTAMTIKNNGNVGIRQTVPGSALSVNGGISAGTYSATAAPSGGMIMSGNVGIGTTAPSFSLSFGANTVRTIGVEESALSGIGLTMSAGAAATGGADLNGGYLILSGGNSTGTGYSGVRFLSATAGAGGTNTNVATEVMRIQNGNVGIGTVTTNSKLEIAGNTSLLTYALKWGTTGSEDVAIIRSATKTLKITDGAAGYGNLSVGNLTVNGTITGLSTTVPYFEVSPAVTYSYSNPMGTGNRATTVTVTDSGNILTSGSIQDLVDGATGSIGGWGDWASLVGKWIRFDFGRQVVITEITFRTTAVMPCVAICGSTWNIHGSNDGTSWTLLTPSPVALYASPSVWSLNSELGYYRYYRMIGVDGQSYQGAQLAETEFKISTDTTDVESFINRGKTTLGKTTISDISISDATPTLSDASFTTCTSLTTVSNVVTCTVSDKNVKTNFNDFNKGLDFIRKIQPQTYSFQEGTPYFDNNRVRLGLIAQDVEAAGLKDAVLPIGNGLSQIDFNAVTAATISAVKELDLNLESLGVDLVSAPATPDSFVGRVFKNIKTTISTWLADVGNGIGNIFADTFHAKEKICINNTCVTEAQLQTLLQNSGFSAPKIETPLPVVTPPPTTPVVDQSITDQEIQKLADEKAAADKAAAEAAAQAEADAKAAADKVDNTTEVLP